MRQLSKVPNAAAAARRLHQASAAGGVMASGGPSRRWHDSWNDNFNDDNGDNDDDEDDCQVGKDHQKGEINFYVSTKSSDKIPPKGPKRAERKKR